MTCDQTKNIIWDCTIFTSSVVAVINSSREPEKIGLEGERLASCTAGRNPGRSSGPSCPWKLVNERFARRREIPSCCRGN